jgi:hypothetical protein
MEHQQIESVGKVFEVVGERRKCLICERVFTPTQAANHATAPCRPAATPPANLRYPLDFVC